MSQLSDNVLAVAKTGKAIAPAAGQVARVRSRTYLVEAVEPNEGRGTLVRMVCLDDDAQGQPLEVVWELELEKQILDQEAWQSIGKRGFDSPRYFSAYIHTLRWNCVTATDPRLFQSPFRAGIRVDAYQLEPLRKALLLPRVNLFIADDVGLGKTIEAALIASELLLRRRVREIVVACPPSMLLQWKDELENRFGLTFEIMDRLYVQRVRQEYGYNVRPWATFPRFLISHRLLIDEAYTGPLLDHLGTLRPGTLFIFDEAHHAAPSSGARYAIDSRITKAIREIAPRFEHRLFLSATPHNGHSNSFSALLELLDPQRFTRGVKVLKSNLDGVMVRRLKEDIREMVGGFPKRVVEQVDIAGLPEDAPELVLSRLLDEYNDVRQRRMAGSTKRKQAEAALLVSHLQQRLLSSVDAFARTLAVHRRTMERIWAGEQAPPAEPSGGTAAQPRFELLSGRVDSDDERSALSEPEQQEMADHEVEAATSATAGNSSTANPTRERKLLDDMARAAEQVRGQPDARIRHVIEWVRQHMCPGARLPGKASPQPGTKWTDLRLLIFTEYDDTERYIVAMLRAAIAGTADADRRIEVFHGPTPIEKREAIKRAFNLPPSEHPLRILVATDAAREGINLQACCHNLFHFDVPWNPSRLEQRNGRIDRKLQPAPEVHCHYFVYTQRPEDRVLRALVRKTETIRQQLGSLAQVIENRLTETLRAGIRHADTNRIEAEIEAADIDPEKRATTEEELEATRERQDKLREQLSTLRNRINDARGWIGLDTEHFRDALSCSLELLGAEPLKPVAAPPGTPARYVFPDLATRFGADPSWSGTLDTLRAPPEDGERGFAWRRDSPIRPVVFDSPATVDDDVVQLHLAHRTVQRLLGRFLAQGFVHQDLSRACLAQTTDAVPRVVLLGRLSIYGKGAVRLHDEMLFVTAQWTEPAGRRKPLAPYAREAEAKTLDLLEAALQPQAGRVPQVMANRLLMCMPRDIGELLPHLQTRGEDARVTAEKSLAERGSKESESLRQILEDQKRRVAAELGKPFDPRQREFDFTDLERRQMDSNRRYWQHWLKNVDRDLSQEPVRILDFYKVNSYRIEPVGMAYLWPVTG